MPPIRPPPPHAHRSRGRQDEGLRTPARTACRTCYKGVARATGIPSLEADPSLQLVVCQSSLFVGFTLTTVTMFAVSAPVTLKPRTTKPVSFNAKKVNAPCRVVTTSHCQVPCGIFDDKREIASLSEDVATIRKAQTEMKDLCKRSMDVAATNTFTRWVMYKEKHADDIIYKTGYALSLGCVRGEAGAASQH
eukprot:scaffold926_cov408-Prasinococcus_capsulatus_cf.AAC.12